jgi:hypothetical protein
MSYENKKKQAGGKGRSLSLKATFFVTIGENRIRNDEV